MSHYQKLYEVLGLSRRLQGCASGEIKSPIIGLKSPAEWYVFPPALIPIWSDGSSPYYIGYWKHWFTDRKPCYVQMYVDAGYMVKEIARTEAQLFALMTIEAIVADDEVTPDIHDFAISVGVSNLQELDNLTLISGDDPKGFSQLPQFQTYCPLESITEIADYDGDFPNSDFGRVADWLQQVCSFETTALNIEWPILAHKPMWLESGLNKKSMFECYIAERNLRAAWLCLNSSGWALRDASSALEELAKHAHDDAFNLLVDAWLLMSKDQIGGY